jgi:hypothetical protein
MFKSKLLWKSIAFLAFLGFGYSLTVHLAAVFSLNTAYHFPFGNEFISSSLHIGCLLSIVCMMKIFKVNGVSSINIAGNWVPIWGKRLLILFACYTAINFAWFIFASYQISPSGKQPYIFNGKCMIYRNGGTYEIPIQQCNQYQAIIWKGFSGHWMLFYLETALNLFYLPLNIQSGNSET